MVPVGTLVRKRPFSSPGLPALPATTPVISTGTISPLSSEIVVPVSTSWMECPKPAKVPVVLSTKVSVPMPAEESRTHMPVRQLSVVESFTAVSSTDFSTPSRT